MRPNNPQSAGPNPQSKRPQSVELHIEELVLHGFAPGDRHFIGDAVERELALLFAAQGVPSSLMQGGEFERLDGGKFEVTPDSSVKSIGLRVAQAIYQGSTRCTPE